MGYKKTARSLDFADLALANCLEQNRSIKLMEQPSASINWSRVESILLNHYTVGPSEEGACAYPPLILFKCLLLQKWLRIQSDPELENQIYDRFSFEIFLGLSFSQPAPDHSTFSRFRSRLPKETMDLINSEILRHFEQQGLAINKGVAVDVRLAESASRPLSQEELKKQRENRQTEEGKRDKNGIPLKFTQDLESDWTVRSNTPHFGSKNIRRWMPNTALCWPPPSPRPRSTIPLCCLTAPLTAVIPNARSKRPKPIRATPVSPTGTSYPLIKTKMASCARTPPPPS